MLIRVEFHFTPSFNHFAGAGLGARPAHLIDFF